MTEVPKITREEAAILLLAGQATIPISVARSLAGRGMLWLGDDDGTFNLVATNALGRAALSAYEAEREREIRDKMRAECIAALQRLAKRMEAKGRRAECNQTLLAIGEIEMEVTP